MIPSPQNLLRLAEIQLGNIYSQAEWLWQATGYRFDGNGVGNKTKIQRGWLRGYLGNLSDHRVAVKNLAEALRNLDGAQKRDKTPIAIQQRHLRDSICRLSLMRIRPSDSLQIEASTAEDILDAVLACKVCQSVLLSFKQAFAGRWPRESFVELPQNLVITGLSKNELALSRATGPHLHRPTAISTQLVQDLIQRCVRRPWLTVVIPTLGRSSLYKTIQSLKDQNTAPFEVLIVNGSGDSVSGLVPDMDTNINVATITEILAKDDSPYDAMNLGLALSAGQWIYFMGDDDALADPTVLDSIKAVTEEGDLTTDLIFGLVRMLGEGSGTYDGQVWRYDVDYSSLRTSPVCHQACFYRVSRVVEAEGYNRRFSVCGDWDLNLRIWQQSQPRFIDKVICDFARGGLSSTRKDKHFFDLVEQIWEENSLS